MQSPKMVSISDLTYAIINTGYTGNLIDHVDELQEEINKHASMSGVTIEYICDDNGETDENDSMTDDDDHAELVADKDDYILYYARIGAEESFKYAGDESDKTGSICIKCNYVSQAFIFANMLSRLHYCKYLEPESLSNIVYDDKNGVIRLYYMTEEI